MLTYFEGKTALKRGKFITLEGTEGSGKSVQLRLLEKEFRRRKIPFVSTHEPGGTALGVALRRILLRRDGAKREPISELLLYLADRYQDLKEIIEPALSGGLHVVCDRYHDATLAYQGYARGIGFSRIDRVAKILALRMPDLTFVFDVSVPIALDRARARNVRQRVEKWGRFEDETLEFHEKVREGYRLLAQRHPRRISVIEASGTPVEVWERVLRVLEERRIL